LQPVFGEGIAVHVADAAFPLQKVPAAHSDEVIEHLFPTEVESGITHLPEAPQVPGVIQADSKSQDPPMETIIPHVFEDLQYDMYWHSSAVQAEPSTFPTHNPPLQTPEKHS